jgi:hypothetical protein
MRMTMRQILGLTGCSLLIAGVFLPIVTIPLMGDMNFFEVGNFNGVTDYSFTGIAYGIIGLGAASVLLILLNYCRGLLITGLFSLTVFVLTIKQFMDIGKILNDNAGVRLMMNITGIGFGYSNLRWAWTVLFSGAFILVVTSFLKSEAKQGVQ